MPLGTRILLLISKKNITKFEWIDEEGRWAFQVGVKKHQSADSLIVALCIDLQHNSQMALCFNGLPIVERRVVVNICDVCTGKVNQFDGGYTRPSYYSSAHVPPDWSLIFNDLIPFPGRAARGCARSGSVRPCLQWQAVLPTGPVQGQSPAGVYEEVWWEFFN